MLESSKEVLEESKNKASNPAVKWQAILEVYETRNEKANKHEKMLVLLITTENKISSKMRCNYTLWNWKKKTNKCYDDKKHQGYILKGSKAMPSKAPKCFSEDSATVLSD